MKNGNKIRIERWKKTKETRSSLVYKRGKRACRGRKLANQVHFIPWIVVPWSHGPVAPSSLLDSLKSGHFFHFQFVNIFGGTDFTKSVSSLTIFSSSLAEFVFILCFDRHFRTHLVPWVNLGIISPRNHLSLVFLFSF